MALVAIWLIAAAPTVSRALAWSGPDLGAWCAEHGLSDEHPSGPASPGDLIQHHERCGYCVLLSHSPLLAGGVPTITMAAWLPTAAPVTRQGLRWHAQPTLSARPRGPPSRTFG